MAAPLPVWVGIVVMVVFVVLVFGLGTVCTFQRRKDENKKQDVTDADEESIELGTIESGEIQLSLFECK